jgi:hypothetical protein
VAHAFIKPEVIVATALGMLNDELLLSRFVTRKAGADFAGAKNDTIDLKIPAILDAREYDWRNNRAAPIETDDLVEYSIPVTLNKDPYSAVKITDEELTLDIKDFAAQVLAPQVTAVATKLDSYIATLMATGTDYATTIEVDADTDNLLNDLVIPARKALNLSNVPTQNRVIVLGANVEAWALKHELLQKVNESGTSSVLREAVIGRLGGFTIVGNVNTIDPDKAYAFHPSAYVFANMAPAVPAGVSAGASASHEGFALRWLRDYDAMYLRDRSVVSSFAGTASVEDERDSAHELTGKNCRAVEIDFFEGS